MLPPGHIAAGYLTAEVLLKAAHPGFSQSQTSQLLIWGMFFGFAPDIDMFMAFAKVHSWWYKPGKDSGIHRKFYGHVPILWLIAGLLIYFLASSMFVKYVGLLLWLGSWTHFLLDSIEYGVMWLWPLNSEVWALKDRGVNAKIDASGFTDYWVKMLKMYSKRWTFYCEIIILIIFFINFFLNHHF